MSKRAVGLVGMLLLAFSMSVAGCGPNGNDNVEGADATIPELPDEDGDGIADVHEGKADGVDTDGDGTPDYQDDDSDGDGIPDYREGGDALTGTPPVDSDGDGTPDFQDTDSDANGREDGLDGVEDLDGDGIGNFADLDDDGDGINDVNEIGPSPSMPVDFDSDGTPDFQDTDSDNDTILDLHEGAADPDMDGLPNYQDADADGDCVGDQLEAGDGILSTPPVDTDGDLQKDFLDLDSDNDGLLDSLEDVNCNGVADSGESSRVDEDSDGDGVSDLIEEAAGTDPTNPADNPQANGDFVFIVPYMAPPSPTDDTLDFSTTISQADVVFAMDTTGSMSQEISNLTSSVTNLINTIRGQIPNTGFAVVGYDDFPTTPYGGSGDIPFRMYHRAMTTNTAAGLSSITSQVGVLGASGGSDGPESGWEMMYQVATGAGTTQGGANVPAFNPATANPAVPPAGELTGTIGGVGFRAGSLPIVVWMTDACNHNSGVQYGYSGFTAATRAQAVTELMGLSARVIAAVSDPQTGGCDLISARDEIVFAVNQTGSIVPPEAWGPAGTRPGSCPVGQCCTGLNGAGEGTVGGQCPLLFRIDGNTGAGLGDAVATAVGVLTTYGLLDIGAVAVDDPVDAVDAVVSFIAKIETNNTVGGVCATGLTVADLNLDTINETFQAVNPGTTVCFDVVPKMNTTVMPLNVPQMFKATIVVEGNQVTTLDTRDIFFLVPPEIEDIPID